MRWEDSRLSDNVEDRRGQDDGGGGGGFAIPGGSGGLGLGAIIVLSLIGWALGIDPRVLIGGAEVVTGGGGSGYVQPQAPDNRQAPAQQSASSVPADATGKFVAAILGEDEDVWSEILPAQKGVKFVPAKLVLYSGQTQSGCGGAQSAMGPFYCPVDKKIYLDTSFFNDMKTRYGGGGDFAYAYVISHEMGHHIQDLLGILSKVNRAEQNAATQSQANALSVRIELQADCLAGVWAANADRKWQILQPGDIQKALDTAAAIGDDRLQKASRSIVVPDSFTHGSSAQRAKWLQTGLDSGQVDSCNTFAQ